MSIKNSLSSIIVGLFSAGILAAILLFLLDGFGVEAVRAVSYPTVTPYIYVFICIILFVGGMMAALQADDVKLGHSAVLSILFIIIGIIQPDTTSVEFLFMCSCIFGGVVIAADRNWIRYSTFVGMLVFAGFIFVYEYNRQTPIRDLLKKTDLTLSGPDYTLAEYEVMLGSKGRERKSAGIAGLEEIVFYDVIELGFTDGNLISIVVDPPYSGKVHGFSLGMPCSEARAMLASQNWWDSERENLDRPHEIPGDTRQFRFRNTGYSLYMVEDDDHKICQIRMWDDRYTTQISTFNF